MNRKLDCMTSSILLAILTIINNPQFRCLTINKPIKFLFLLITNKIKFRYNSLKIYSSYLIILTERVKYLLCTIII